MDIERTKELRFLKCRCKALKDALERTLRDNSNVTGRYSSYKTYALEYESLVKEIERCIDLSNVRIMGFNTSKMRGSSDTLWSQQKGVIECLVMYVDVLIALIDGEMDFVEDEYSNIENFISAKLRRMMYTKPENEYEVQNAIESLFIGKGWNKGIDYDRETGKLEFSGKEYIPDFVIPKYNLCIEVKLIKEGRKSKVIEEINADITAYSKEYKRLLFVVYDLGYIRDELEFKRDIENVDEGIKVIVVKQ